MNVLPLFVATFVFGDAANEIPGTAHTTAPDPVTGQLLRLTADGMATIRVDGQETPPRPLLEWRHAGQPRPDRPRQPLLIFANGDAVPATVIGGDRRAVRVRPQLPGVPADADWAVPLSSLAAVWLVPPPANTPPDPDRYPWREDARRQDAVLLRNGDVALGTVETVGGTGSVRLVTTRGQPPRVIPLAQVASIAFDPTLIRSRRPKGVAARVVGVGGSRLTLTESTCDGQVFTGKTLFGETVTLPLAEIAAVDVTSDTVINLADLKPKTAMAEGFLGVSWPWQKNRSAKGNLLKLADPDGIDTFDTGLGTHPRTRLVYDLGGKYRRFDALVGLDPVTGRRGSAGVRILVDGEDRPIPGLIGMSSPDSPVAVRVDVTGAKELILIVDFGRGGGVQADVNWANARLVGDAADPERVVPANSP